VKREIIGNQINISRYIFDLFEDRTLDSGAMMKVLEYECANVDLRLHANVAVNYKSDKSKHMRISCSSICSPNQNTLYQSCINDSGTG